MTILTTPSWTLVTFSVDLGGRVKIDGYVWVAWPAPIRVKSSVAG